MNTFKRNTPPQKGTVRSTSNEARKIIRGEIKKYYTGKGGLTQMKTDANNYSYGKRYSDWEKGSRLVDAGSFACYHSDQKKMLKKIYGSRVEDWDGDKTHGTYRGLIGREYAAMLREREDKKIKKRAKNARK